MSLFSITLLAVGLAMDAAAVSATRGLATPELRPRHFFLVALFFGGFQMLMPLVGGWIGRWWGPWIAAWDHWIAFGLLTALGIKMLREAFAESEGEAAAADPFDLRIMLTLAIATSVDAFAVGIMLPVLKAPMLLSLLTIGSVTALLSMGGLIAGRRFGALLGKRFDVAGGVVLVGLGIKILIEHLSA